MNSLVAFGLESAAWPALMVDAKGAVLRANAAASAAFDSPNSSDAPHLLAIWHPENNGSPMEFLARWEASPKPTADLKFRAANGAIIKFAAAICAFNKDGQKRFILQLLPAVEPVVIHAAPEAQGAPALSSAIENMDPAGVALKQKLDCALQLARTISLDFNNALTSVLGHTSLLLGKAEGGHPWRHSLMEVEKSAARAAEIANELQTFSRQEKETRRVPPGNLNTVATRCADFFRNASGAKITWDLQLENKLFGARFDEAKVQQALTKILENAVEVIGDAANGRITLQTRNVDLAGPTQDLNVRLAAGAYVCMEVTDNGAGIDPEVLPRIFEPFFTTKGTGHRGLGLALVYGIVTNHGGGVAVSSHTGSGTTARIYLPAEKGLIREAGAGSQDLRGTETVLVVDDETMLLTMAETILMEFGYKVLTTNGGQKALAILSRDDTKVDLVLTDMVMPGMGGRELVERIRQLSPATKLLCMSGYIMPADKQASTPYLQKPFTSKTLLLKVKQTLANGASVD